MHMVVDQARSVMMPVAVSVATGTIMGMCMALPEAIVCAVRTVESTHMGEGSALAGDIAAQKRLCRFALR